MEENKSSLERDLQLTLETSRPDSDGSVFWISRFGAGRMLQVMEE